MTKRMQIAVNIAMELQWKYDISMEKAADIALNILLELESKKPSKLGNYLSSRHLSENVGVA